MILGQWIGPAFTPAASTLVADEVGANNLTLNGGDNTDAIDAAGPTASVDVALTFNGSDDNLSGNCPLSAPTNGTICMWIYMTAAGNFPMFFTPGDATAGAEFRCNGTSRQPQMINQATQSIVSSLALSLNTWQHVAVTWTGIAFEIFVDAISRGTTSIAAPTFRPTMRIGSRPANAFPFTGRLADIRLYDSNEGANLATIMAGVVAKNAAQRYYQQMMAGN